MHRTATEYFSLFLFSSFFLFSLLHVEIHDQVPMPEEYAHISQGCSSVERS